VYNPDKWQVTQCGQSLTQRWLITRSITRRSWKIQWRTSTIKQLHKIAHDFLFGRGWYRNCEEKCFIPTSSIIYVHTAWWTSNKIWYNSFGSLYLVWFRCAPETQLQRRTKRPVIEPWEYTALGLEVYWCWLIEVILNKRLMLLLMYSYSTFASLVYHRVSAENELETKHHSTWQTTVRSFCLKRQFCGSVPW